MNLEFELEELNRSMQKGIIYIIKRKGLYTGHIYLQEPYESVKGKYSQLVVK